MNLQQEQACWKLELEDSSWVSKFDPSKKKKKKKKRKPRMLHFAEDEPDYTYKELLSRVYNMLRENDLEVCTERPRTVIMPPQLLAQGTQTTVCLNFAHLCRVMRRKPEHFMKFILGQMETKEIILLDKQQGLEMNGLVSCKDFQAVFRKYIDAFVICSCCKSPDTALTEEKGLFTVRCEMCGLVASSC